MTFAGSYPGLTSMSRTKLLTRSAAPASRTIDRRDLRDDEQAPKTIALEEPEAAHPLDAGLVERADDVDARSLEGGRKAEQQAGDDRERAREHEDAQVERDFIDPRDVTRRDWPKRRCRPNAISTPSRPPAEAEQHAFREQLTQQPSALGAKAVRPRARAGVRRRAREAGWRYWRWRSAARNRQRPTGRRALAARQPPFLPAAARAECCWAEVLRPRIPGGIAGCVFCATVVPSAAALARVTSGLTRAIAPNAKIIR